MRSPRKHQSPKLSEANRYPAADAPCVSPANIRRGEADAGVFQRLWWKSCAAIAKKLMDQLGSVAPTYFMFGGVQEVPLLEKVSAVALAAYGVTLDPHVPIFGGPLAGHADVLTVAHLLEAPRKNLVYRYNRQPH